MSAPAPSAPARYEVEARIVRPGRAEIAARGSRIAFDSSPGPPEGLPGPAELLAAAFAACLLKNVERFSEILGFHQDGARVHVVVERQERPPRFSRVEYRLHLRTDEPPQRVALLERNLRRHGTVYNTIAAACVVEGEVVAEPPAG
ncbi:MAG: OsmC family protein [Thermoleophilia bacterium]|jgi:uncharacterized OsmC-like protein|nr:OsmC family protein [Thermoleophilia bacterium]